MPTCTKALDDGGERATVGFVLVVIVDEFFEILVGEHIVARHHLARGIYRAELPARERFAAIGGVSQRLYRGLRIAGVEIADAGAQRIARALECARRHDFLPARRQCPVKRQRRRACEDDGDAEAGETTADDRLLSRKQTRKHVHRSHCSHASGAAPNDCRLREPQRLVALTTDLSKTRLLWRNRGANSG